MTRDSNILLGRKELRNWTADREDRDWDLTGRLRKRKKLQPQDVSEIMTKNAKMMHRLNRLIRKITNST